MHRFFLYSWKAHVILCSLCHMILQQKTPIATTTIAEATTIEDKLSKKYCFRGNWARFTYWFWGHDRFSGKRSLTVFPLKQLFAVLLLYSWKAHAILYSLSHGTTFKTCLLLEIPPFKHPFYFPPSKLQIKRSPRINISANLWFCPDTVTSII